MAIKAISGIMPEWYTLETDETKEAQFKIRPLSSAERLDVIGINSKGLTGQAFLMTCKYGVMDYKGFKDSDGNETPFSSEALKDLPPGAMAELADKILRISTLSDAERKN